MTKEKHPATKTTGLRHSCPSYVHSRITVYHASKIDLRYCRSLHSCASCEMGQLKDPCGAIHFGVCSAVVMPPSKLRKRSGASWLTAVSRPVTGFTRDGGAVYYRSANLVNQSRPNSPKTRSLAILREGHELAGTPLDNRAAVFQTGVFRLHPQRQGLLSATHHAANSGNFSPHVGSNVVISTGRGQGGGMAIRLSPGQANIISDGNTDIEIQGQGRAIHIQSSGGQNVRFRSMVGPGGHPGHVINIQGNRNQGLVNYPGYIEASPITVPLPVDVVDSPSGPESLTPKSFLSTKQIAHQKPTARVAPAPVVASVPTTSRTIPPAALLGSQSPLEVSPFVGSPASIQPSPPFYESSAASAPPSSAPLTSGSPVATISPTKQPVVVASKETDSSPNHASQPVTETQAITPDTIHDRPDSTGRPVSDQTNRGRHLPHQAQEAYLNNENQSRSGPDIFQPPRQQTLKESIPQPTTSNNRQKTSENNQQPKPQQPLSPSSIPQFYYPSGRPDAGTDMKYILQNVAQAFNELEGGKAYKEHMGSITKACGFPLYWKILLFRAAGGASEGFVTYQGVSVLLRKLHQSCHDAASRFAKLTAKPGARVMEFEDFEPLIQDVIITHPGLTFLQDAPEFHSRYVTTVISRIMFCVNRSWTGRITLPELRKSNFLQTVVRLEQEEDINQIKDYFSYEHFYVIYCKFWELDKDHDLFIDREDLSRYNDHALSSRIIDRIFSGAVTRGPNFQEGKMSYKEFVWFLLAEVDKKHPTSIEYWFRCMDLDGDGVISMYEMEYFHEEQMMKMETLGIERLPFEDTVCQMMDMVSQKVKERITLRDLKACKMTDIFFDTFFNLDKFLEHEQRDPFTNARPSSDPEKGFLPSVFIVSYRRLRTSQTQPMFKSTDKQSEANEEGCFWQQRNVDPDADLSEDNDWNRYAEEEYDILVADEGNMDLDNRNYEADFEPEDDALLQDEILRSMQIEAHHRPPGEPQSAEDGFEFSSVPF